MTTAARGQHDRFVPVLTAYLEKRRRAGAGHLLILPSVVAVLFTYRPAVSDVKRSLGPPPE